MVQREGSQSRDETNAVKLGAVGAGGGRRLLNARACVRRGSSINRVRALREGMVPSTAAEMVPCLRAVFFYALSSESIHPPFFIWSSNGNPAISPLFLHQSQNSNPQGQNHHKIATYIWRRVNVPQFLVGKRLTLLEVL